MTMTLDRYLKITNGNEPTRIFPPPPSLYLSFAILTVQLQRPIVNPGGLSLHCTYVKKKKKYMRPLVAVLVAAAAVAGTGRAPGPGRNNGQCRLRNVLNRSCDGTVDDTLLLQNALHECSGSSVTISAGAVCTSGPLQLPSHARLVIEGEGLLQALHRKDWPRPKAGDPVQDFIVAINAVNVTLTGTGRIDGRGSEWWPTLLKPDSASGRPRTLLFQHTSRVLLEQLNLTNAAFFHVDIRGGSDYVIRHLRIRSPNFQKAPNTDGIDIAATNVHVYDVDVSNGDDSLCIKSPAHNVLIENSTVAAGNGLVVGTADVSNITNITFRNIFANDTTFGCHIKFKDQQSGLCRDVLFDRITILQTASAYYRRILHFDHAGYALGIHQQNQGARGRLKASGSTVKISNIMFQHIQASGLFAGQFECASGALACENISLAHVHLNSSKKGCVFSNTYGSSSDVEPASCVPPSH